MLSSEEIQAQQLQEAVLTPRSYTQGIAPGAGLLAGGAGLAVRRPLELPSTAGRNGPREASLPTWPDRCRRGAERREPSPDLAQVTHGGSSRTHGSQWGVVAPSLKPTGLWGACG